jgi:hypothetical protein
VANRTRLGQVGMFRVSPFDLGMKGRGRIAEIAVIARHRRDRNQTSTTESRRHEENGNIYRGLTRMVADQKKRKKSRFLAALRNDKYRVPNRTRWDKLDVSRKSFRPWDERGGGGRIDRRHRTTSPRSEAKHLPWSHHEDTEENGNIYRG